MSNLSDKEIDRLSREAADSYEPDHSSLSWSRLEQKLDHAGKAAFNDHLVAVAGGGLFQDTHPIGAIAAGIIPDTIHMVDGLEQGGGAQRRDTAKWRHAAYQRAALIARASAPRDRGDK